MRKLERKEVGIIIVGLAIICIVFFEFFAPKSLQNEQILSSDTTSYEAAPIVEVDSTLEERQYTNEELEANKELAEASKKRMSHSEFLSMLETDKGNADTLMTNKNEAAEPFEIRPLEEQAEVKKIRTEGKKIERHESKIYKAEKIKVRALDEKEEEVKAQPAEEKEEEVSIYRKPPSKTTKVADQKAVTNNFINAVVHSDHKIRSNSIVRIRILEPCTISGKSIAAQTIVTGICNGSSENRVKIHVSSINYKGQIIPVQLTVYDIDGIQGIYTSGGINNEIKQDGVDDALNKVNINIPVPGIGSISTGTGAIRKKVNEPYVNLRNGHKIILKSE